MPRADTPDAPESGHPDPTEEDVGGASILAGSRPLSEQHDYIKALYSGEPGTGKTTALAAMANLGPIIYINAEGGLKRRPLEQLGVAVDQIQVLPEKPEDLTFEWLEDLYWELASTLRRGSPVVGVVWDSITEIHQALLRNVVDYQLERSSTRGESRIKGAVPGDMLDRSFIDLSDYGVMTSQMRLLLRRYRDLPCHFGVSALLQRDMDDDGKVAYRPAVTPKLGLDLVGFMDVVAVTRVSEGRHQGLFAHRGKYRGKDRFGVLPQILNHPTFDRVTAYVEGDLDPAQDPLQQELDTTSPQGHQQEESK